MKESDHAASLVSGCITCDCGWSSGHHAVAIDAIADYHDHLAEYGVSIDD